MGRSRPCGSRGRALQKQALNKRPEEPPARVERCPASPAPCVLQSPKCFGGEQKEAAVPEMRVENFGIAVHACCSIDEGSVSQRARRARLSHWVSDP